MTAEIPSHFKLDTQPAADPAAIVPAGLARFTILTDRLLRLEYAPDGRFEDRATQVFWQRRQPVPSFTVTPAGDGLTIRTDCLELVYRGGPLNGQTISITVTGADDNPWQPGLTDTGNLLGTCRTLDQISGSVPLEKGLLSRTGWTVIDDSDSLVFGDADWLQPRGAHKKYQDLYFLGYGNDFQACLRDYTRLTGSVPLLPRWALGNWWSRYWEYTQTELMELMLDFEAHEVPLSVCIVDMDWHLTDTGGRGSGWTGYTWNRALFPDPAGFVTWLHERGLRTALNLHPALGVRAHEQRYPALAERMGVDPATEEPIPFTPSDPTFMKAYFEVLHHPEEEETGIDFWWMDWQQGKETRMPGLDPLWWLNHLHFYDLGRDGVTRPFIFSRWGGLGNHRYPIGFSGDTFVNWETLAFQPYFTATAANVAYGWWSHDIGGHNFGIEEAELYRRWVQFGVFSPIMRLHSTKNALHERRPWGYDAETLDITRRALRLRHRLVPYLYSEGQRFSQSGRAPIRPLYHDYPEQEAAYHCPQQYTFGDQLLAAPFVSPADNDTRLSRQVVWLPPGDWYHFFDGDHYPGAAWHAVYGGADEIPVFAPAGGIIPLAGDVDVNTLPSAFTVHCFTGRSGAFTLYEDDGVTTAYQAGAYVETTIRQEWQDTGVTITIEAAQGDVDLLPAERAYAFHIYGIPEPTAALFSDPALGKRATPPAYDFERRCLTVAGVRLSPAQSMTLRLEWPAGAAKTTDSRPRRVRRAVHAFHMETAAKAALLRIVPELVEDPTRLIRFAPRLSPSQRQALIEILTGSGVVEIRDTDVPYRYVLWNNDEHPGISCRFARSDEGQWDDDARFTGNGGHVPRFRALTFDPEAKARLSWEVRVDYLGLTQVAFSGHWQ